MESQTNKALAFFAAVGGLAIIILIYKIIYFFSPYVRTGSIKAYLQSDEPWALVTGSSDGIGYAMAYELSAKGFNVILHGRNAAKLSKIQAELSAAFPAVKYRLFVADAAASPEKMATAIAEFVNSIGDLNLRVLMNNVGGTANMPKAFMTLVDHTTKEINDLISTNLLFTTHLTHALIPLLTEHQPSLILNTGSASHTGIVYLPVYSATKAYLSIWGNAMSIEMQAEGLNIEVLTVLSGNTQSGQDKRPTTLMRPSSKRFAKEALKKVGIGRSVVTGYLGHAVLPTLVDWMPEWAQRLVIISVLKPMKGKNLDG
jgi:17beta-estradiol 17-dehydrogenase / very-long-chain 3-oxoacyl-CoA reductase